MVLRPCFSAGLLLSVGDRFYKLFCVQEKNPAFKERFAFLTLPLVYSRPCRRPLLYLFIFSTTFSVPRKEICTDRRTYCRNDSEVNLTMTRKNILLFLPSYCWQQYG